jgi:hypothetical protein
MNKEFNYSCVKTLNNLPPDIKNTSGNLRDLKEFCTIFCSHSLSVLWRNTIPDDTCGG